MKLGSKHKADPTFNMSSMTDVVFLLLIFFIMTSTNVTPRGKKVNLPKSDVEQKITVLRVQVTLAADRSIQVDEETVTKETLLAAIEKKLSPKDEDKNKNNIVVKGDVSVTYGEVMEIVRICSKIETATVTLQTEEK